jgi:hypothetical protein
MYNELAKKLPAKKLREVALQLLKHEDSTFKLYFEEGFCTLREYLRKLS